MSEETKLAKFEVILGDIRNWLGKGIIDVISDFYEKYGTKTFLFQFNDKLYHSSIFDKYESNNYVNAVLKTTLYFDKGFDFFDSRGFSTITCDAIQLIKAYKSAPDNVSRNRRNIMTFWMLFVAALDDEIYNNELDSIIDLAYCMDFNEVMIRDWCHAVEYVMQGNHFSINCDLQCETAEGKRFFLHEGVNEAAREIASASSSIIRKQTAQIASIGSFFK